MITILPYKVFVKFVKDTGVISVDYFFLEDGGIKYWPQLHSQMWSGKNCHLIFQALFALFFCPFGLLFGLFVHFLGGEVVGDPTS